MSDTIIICTYALCAICIFVYLVGYDWGGWF
jgi:hypothetical protein